MRRTREDPEWWVLSWPKKEPPDEEATGSRLSCSCWEALEEARLAKIAENRRRGVEKARKTRARNATEKERAARIWCAWAKKQRG